MTLRDGDRTIKIREGSNSYGKNGLGSGSAEAKNVFDGDGSTGWSTAQREGEAHQLVLVLEEPLQVIESLKIEMLFERHYATSLGRFRWSVSSSDKKATAQDLSASLQAALVKEPAQWTEAERQQLVQHFALTCEELKEARKEIDQLRKSMPTPPTTLVMQERTTDNPRPTQRHHRGEYLSPKEAVTGGVPEIFRALTTKPPTNRLELARWLASKDNPLVGRVVINRVWQSLFGDGLVRSQGDFGMQSSPPTHPELLDWLAVDWMESGWSMKKLLRDIVLSATYQQVRIHRLNFGNAIRKTCYSHDFHDSVWMQKCCETRCLLPAVCSASGSEDQVSGRLNRPRSPHSLMATKLGLNPKAPIASAVRFTRFQNGLLRLQLIKPSMHHQVKLVLCVVNEATLRCKRLLC